MGLALLDVVRIVDEDGEGQVIEVALERPEKAQVYVDLNSSIPVVMNASSHVLLPLPQK